MTFPGLIFFISLVPLEVLFSYLGYAVLRYAIVFVLFILIHDFLEILYLRKHLDIGEIRYAQSLYRGAVIDYEFDIFLHSKILRSHGSLRVWRGLYDNLQYPEAGEVKLTLPPRTKTCAKISRKSLHTGVTSLDKMELKFYSTLRLFSFKIHLIKKPQERLFTEVLPLFPHASENLTHKLIIDDGTTDRRKTFDVGDEVDTIHEYKTGDSLKKAHWPVSARFDKIMIKDYTTEQSEKVLFIADVFNEALLSRQSAVRYGLFFRDQMLDYLNYSIYNAQKQGYNISLLTAKSESRQDLSYNHVKTFHHVGEAEQYLAHLPILHKEPALCWLLSDKALLSQYTHLSVVTGAIDRAVTERLILLKMQGFNVSVKIFVLPEACEIQKRIKSELLENGVKCELIFLAAEKFGDQDA